jgi:hypothetical protein
MTGSKSRAAFTVEIFMEEDVITPVGVVLEEFYITIECPLAVFIEQENLCQAAR